MLAVKTRAIQSEAQETSGFINTRSSLLLASRVLIILIEEACQTSDSHYELC